jgi:hypothetical protein
LSVLSPDGSERDIPKAARLKQNLNQYEQSTNLQNHRDDRSGIADVLRSSAWNDELQSMADDLDDVKLRSAERQHQDDHYYLHEDGGGVSGETEVKPSDL